MVVPQKNYTKACGDK